MKSSTKLSILVAALAAAGLSIYGWYHWTVCPFKAVVSDGTPEPRLHEVPTKKEDKKAILAVLARHGERFKEKDEVILITPRLYFDQELRWNYTTKR